MRLAFVVAAIVELHVAVALRVGEENDLNASDSLSKVGRRDKSCCGRKQENKDDSPFVSFKLKDKCDTSGLFAETFKTAHKHEVDMLCCSSGNEITPQEESACNPAGQDAHDSVGIRTGEVDDDEYGMWSVDDDAICCCNADVRISAHCMAHTDAQNHPLTSKWDAATNQCCMKVAAPAKSKCGSRWLKRNGRPALMKNNEDPQIMKDLCHMTAAAPAEAETPDEKIARLEKELADAKANK